MGALSGSYYALKMGHLYLLSSQITLLLLSEDLSLDFLS